MKKILILAIGQSLRRDDAAGFAAVRRWQALFPEHSKDTGLLVGYLELPGLALLDHLEEVEQVLIVDAVQSGAPPGRLYCLSEKELASFIQGSDSGHGWGIAETLALGRRIQPEKMPIRVDILGIEVKDINLGEGLSTELNAILDTAATEIELWLHHQGGWI
jgi:hydrogenase maturation protease